MIVRVNELGLRIGEDHQHALYTDHEVELVRRLWDDGLSYGKIARAMEMPKSTVRDICTCRRRAQVVAKTKVIEI
jgi:hypothetical protein